MSNSIKIPSIRESPELDPHNEKIRVTKFGAFKRQKKIIPQKQAQGEAQLFKFERPFIQTTSHLMVTITSKDGKWKTETPMNDILFSLFGEKYVFYVWGIPDKNGWISIKEIAENCDGW